MDVRGIDAYLLPGSHQYIKAKYNIKCIMVIRNNIYYGHVWYYTDSNYPNICGIYGLKTSIVNVLARNYSPFRRGISNILFKAIAKQMTIDNIQNIVVPWPLEVMSKILKKYGFQEVNTNDDTFDRLFLNQLTQTSNYFTGNIDLFLNL